MQKIIDEITALTDEWYDLVSSDHHKDRDCHWHINIVWSYGLKPKYHIEHYGYILDEFLVECDSYESALVRLKQLIQRSIERYKEQNSNNK